MASPRHESLASLAVGDSAVVTKVGCERRVARRLMEMGLLPGTRVELVRVAPLGDPVELRVRSYALSIRRSEASAVQVERVAHAVAAAQTVPIAAAPVPARVVVAQAPPRGTP